MQFYAGYSSSL
ncbi:uncharacterized protein FFE2_16052 [Fusarium fujikuroi]|nr:uncharacterized protein FFE2_16052 [Fusarium fujikuroi]